MAKRDKKAGGEVPEMTKPTPVPMTHSLHGGKATPLSDAVSVWEKQGWVVDEPEGDHGIKTSNYGMS